MACSEGERLKDEVLNRIEEYLAAEHAQYLSSSFEEESSRMRAEMAHASLTESRSRYWQHIKMHRCDSSAILPVETVPPDSIAV
jgi:hypothetical protein